MHVRTTRRHTHTTATPEITRYNTVSTSTRTDTHKYMRLHVPRTLSNIIQKSQFTHAMTRLPQRQSKPRQRCLITCARPDVNCLMYGIQISARHTYTAPGRTPNTCTCTHSDHTHAQTHSMHTAAVAYSHLVRPDQPVHWDQHQHRGKTLGRKIVGPFKARSKHETYQPSVSFCNNTRCRRQIWWDTVPTTPVASCFIMVFGATRTRNMDWASAWDARSMKKA